MTKMVTDNPGSSEYESIERCNGLFLYPETFYVSSDAYDFDHELEFIHNHLKSRVLRSPNKLIQQAKSVLDESSKRDNSVITRDRGPMVNSEVLPTVAEVTRRERRPGLGRKRARFSLNPSSQPVVSSEPALNIKDLKDPEEFFKAYERHEVAQREIQRIKGGSLTDLEQHNTTLNKRPRRPGMPGQNKRSIKYKHLYPSDDSKTNNNALSAQENFCSNILSPDHHTSLESDHNITSHGTGLAGSIFKGELEVDEILDQLLSYNCEDLEGDRALNVLQQRLKIKPIEIEKLNLPDFYDIPKIDLKKSSESRKLPKPRHTLPDVDTLLKRIGLSTITPMKHKQGSERSPDDVASPMTPKSPFSPLSLLNQRILRSRSSKDPFSADDIDDEPTTTRYQHINKEFSDVGRQSNIESPMFEKDEAIEVSKMSSSKDLFAANDIDRDLATNISQHIDGGFSDVGRRSDTESPMFEKDEAIEGSKTSPSKDPFAADDIDGDLATNLSQRIVGRQSDTESPLSEKDEAIEVSKTSSSKHSFAADDIDGDLATNLSQRIVGRQSDTESPLSEKDEAIEVSKTSSSKDSFAADDIVGDLATNLSQGFDEGFSDVGRQPDTESPLFKKYYAVEVSTSCTSQVDKVLDVGASAYHLSRADDMIGSNTDNAAMNQGSAVHDADGNTQANINNLQYEVGDTLQETVVPEMSSLDSVDPILDNGVEEHTEIVEERSEVPLDKKRNETSCLQKARKRHELDRRKSLAGAGTMWESGVRRSTRIKCRPLEYWNGERLLYGRIHKSLPTVIGLKYASPAPKGDKRAALKVKSYVSDEHKELVELAALH